MHIYYRFSFNLNVNHTGQQRTLPNRPAWFDKWRNLKGFVNVFKDHKITLAADCVDDQTWDRLNSEFPMIELERTTFGSSGRAFLHHLELSLKLPQNTIVYFVEDDYVHHEGADIILEQGCRASPYVSLYDHPDKYWGENAGKPTKLIMTEDVHWRTVGSTTLTFASNVNQLAVDRDIFYKWCDEHGWMHDHHLFTELTSRYSLITPVPGYASHMDTWVIAKMVDWEDVLNRTSNSV
jgi:hypothetical protein